VVQPERARASQTSESLLKSLQSDQRAVRFIQTTNTNHYYCPRTWWPTPSFFIDVKPQQHQQQRLDRAIIVVLVVASSLAMEDSSSGTPSAPAVPTRNPYAACRPGVSALSSSSSASAGHQEEQRKNITSSRRRTLKDVNQQQQDQQSSSSAATSTTSRTTKRVMCPTPTSALQLFRSLQRPRATTRTARNDDDDYSYSSIHLLTDHYEWTRLDPGRIHELAGAAGTAKTQLALQACIDCAVRGYDCFYVSLKGGHSATVLARLAYRLNQMIPTTAATTSTTTTTTSASAAAAASQRHAILSRIHLRAIRNADELVNDLNRRQDGSCTSMMLRLLVIDSVADVFRGDASTDYPDRALRFIQWVTALRRMYHDCPILILNQVTWTATQPALGMTWAHCVNASFLVVVAVQQNSSTNATTKQQQQQPQPQQPPQRVLSLRRSPVHGPHSIAFVVETGGCVAVVVVPPVVAPQR
jgi:Rad51